MLRRRVRPRVRGIQPVRVRQQDQQVRVHHRRHLGREHVVVAQLQLRYGHRVVFVYYRYGSPRQQDLQRGKGVVVPPSVAEVVPGEQQLRRNVAALLQAAGVFLHQQTLAHGGAGLLRRNGLRPLVVAQQSVARGYRRARHHDHLMPLVPQPCHLCGQRPQPFRRESAGFLRQ